ncbi:MAG: acetate--CoA ligase family protein [bacterium]
MTQKLGNNSDRDSKTLSEANHNNSSDLDAIFRPSSVAVIGASTHKDSIGRVILHNIIMNDFKGKVFPVNPGAQVIHSIKCYPSVLEIPDPVDLAVIVVRRDLVLHVLEQCGAKGVKGVVIITSGYKEVGANGAAREREVVQVVKKYGMRLVGPNCFGVLNTESDVSLNATFSKQNPIPGKIGFMSQSGALGETILNYAQKLHLGFSMFASVGNKADISGNDLLTYWEDDPRTEVILLYLENFGNPQHFTKIAQRISRHKPIIAVKAGRTAAGARAISSHTGVLASIEVGIDAFFDQCGVLRVATVEGLFDLAAAFTNQPIPKGDRVAIVTNAGGPGILATDAVVGLGLKMAQFSDKTTDYLRANLDKAAAVGNPIDVIASGGPDAYRVAMEAAFQDENVDAIIVIFVPPIVVDERAVARAIIEAKTKYKNGKTVLGCFMGAPEGISGTDEMIEHNIPLYTFPESAAQALAAMVKYGRWKELPSGQSVSFDGKREVVQRIIDRTVRKKRLAILGQEAMAILSAYDIPVAKSETIRQAGKLSAAIKEVGLPLVMKIDNPDMIHKTDAGGVILDLRNEGEVKSALVQMKLKFGDRISGILLQEMVRDGVETIMGMHSDPSFGRLMMFGLGGVFVEVMQDVSFKILPFTDLDAREMIASVKGYPLLSGFRGNPAVDINLLEEVLLRLAQLVTDFPQFESFDINPFMASAERSGCKAVDAGFVLKGDG